MKSQKSHTYMNGRMGIEWLNPLEYITSPLGVVHGGSCAETFCLVPADRSQSSVVLNKQASVY